MINKIVKCYLLIGVFVSLPLSPVLYADSPLVEVLSLKGKAYVSNKEVHKKLIKEGESLKAGDLVEVGEDSRLDLAYDEAGENVTRIEANSKVSISRVDPTHLTMSEGGVFAKLDHLRGGSTFEVETPCAIAVVRGTKFRTAADSGGVTKVYNYSDSPVTVFGTNGKGGKSSTSIVLHEAEKTEVAKPGELPKASEKMSVDELSSGNKTEADLTEVQKNKDATPSSKKAGPVEDPQAVLLEMGKAYEAKDFQAFIAHVSEDYSYRGELEEFVRRDFREYSGIRLNFFINRVVNDLDGASVKADWQIQYFPTAAVSPIEVRGSNLDFIFVNENGKLKLKAQRGANPLFGARSPEVATAAGVSSSVATALQNIEDGGNRASRQSALTVVGSATAQADPHTTPVSIQLSNPKVYTGGVAYGLHSIPTTAFYNIQIEVRLADNPRNVNLLNVDLEVTDSASGQILRGVVNLLAGQVNTIRTTGTLVLRSGSSGTFSYVIDPTKQFNFIDRRDAAVREDYGP